MIWCFRWLFRCHSCMCVYVCVWYICKCDCMCNKWLTYFQMSSRAMHLENQSLANFSPHVEMWAPLMVMAILAQWTVELRQRMINHRFWSHKGKNNSLCTDCFGNYLFKIFFRDFQPAWRIVSRSCYLLLLNLCTKSFLPNTHQHYLLTYIVIILAPIGNIIRFLNIYCTSRYHSALFCFCFVFV